MSVRRRSLNLSSQVTQTWVVQRLAPRVFSAVWNRPRLPMNSPCPEADTISFSGVTRFCSGIGYPTLNTFVASSPNWEMRESINSDVPHSCAL